MAHCAYFALSNKLPTRERCSRWSTDSENSCLFCKEEIESSNHLFFDCAYSQYIWYNAKCTLGFNHKYATLNIRDSVNYILKHFKPKSINFNRACVFLTAFIYYNWRGRNQGFHISKETSCYQLWKLIANDCHIIMKKFNRHRDENLHN